MPVATERFSIAVKRGHWLHSKLFARSNIARCNRDTVNAYILIRMATRYVLVQMLLYVFNDMTHSSRLSNKTAAQGKEKTSHNFALE